VISRSPAAASGGGTGSLYWTGIGFNVMPVMNGADLIMAGIYPNGTGAVKDMTSVNYDVSQFQFYTEVTYQK